MDAGQDTASAGAGVEAVGVAGMEAVGVDTEVAVVGGGPVGTLLGRELALLGQEFYPGQLVL